MPPEPPMESYKIWGSILGALLFIQVVNLASQAIFYAPPPEKPAYVPPGMTVASAVPGQPAAAAQEPAPDFATAIPMANVMQGEMIAMQCMACHDFTKGGPNKIGPNLYGVIGLTRASHAGFAYLTAIDMEGGNLAYAD